MEWLKKNKGQSPFWFLGSKIPRLWRIFYSSYVTNKIFISTAALVIIFLIGLEFFLNPIEEAVEHPVVVINGHEFLVEVVDTPGKQSKGLGGRQFLAPKTGMLFTYDQPRQLSFWMKDMQFNIDILWIKDNTIIGIENDVPVENPPVTTYPSPGLVNYVLELNAGDSDKYNIKNGDQISIDIKELRK